MVTAVASGELRILEIAIEPGLVAGGDRGMIQDLCAAACNAALANAQQGAQQEMQRLTGSLGIPGLGALGLGGR
jgi:DNA-binding protein YbaB